MGAPKKPLWSNEEGEGVKRTQLKERVRSIKQKVLNICEEEKVEDPMAILALVARSLFLDTNGKYFEPIKGRFFKEYLQGKYTRI